MCRVFNMAREAWDLREKLPARSAVHPYHSTGIPALKMTRTWDRFLFLQRQAGTSIQNNKDGVRIEQEQRQRNPSKTTVNLEKVTTVLQPSSGTGKLRDWQQGKAQRGRRLVRPSGIFAPTEGCTRVGVYNLQQKSPAIPVTGKSAMGQVGKTPEAGASTERRATSSAE
jgi:hypothetical protein